MKSRRWMWNIAMCLFAALAITLQPSAQGQITAFDAPGAGTGSGQGTIAFGIIAPGAIVGNYLDASNVYHGFLRASNGTITTLTFRARALVRSRAPSPSASTRRGRSRDTTLTQAT